MRFSRDPERAQIAVVGLGYVGLPLAVEFGKHRSVCGFDINQGRVSQLQQGIDHTLEVEQSDLAAATQLQCPPRSSPLA